MNGNTARKDRPVPSMREAVERLERELIVRALSEAGGRQSDAARRLGVSERVLRYKLRKYGLA